MSRSGVGRTTPFLRTRIRAALLDDERAARAVARAGDVAPGGSRSDTTGVSVMSSAVSAGATAPSVVGAGRGAAAAGAGNSVTSSAAPAMATRRRPAAAGTGRDIRHSSGRATTARWRGANPARPAALVDPTRPADRPGHRLRTYPRAMTSGTTDPVSISRRWGAQSMTAPLREVLVKAPGPAFGAAFHHHGGGLPAPGRPRCSAPRARRPRRAPRPARRRRPSSSTRRRTTRTSSTSSTRC